MLFRSGLIDLAQRIEQMSSNNSAENKAVVALLGKLSGILDDVTQGGTSLRTVVGT